MKKNQPHLVRTETIYVDGTEPRQRGMARASQIAAHIRATVRAYSELYSAQGISETDATAAARASMDAIRNWDPDQHFELLGVAAGSGITAADLGLIVGRTEILTLAKEQPQECSTVTFQQPGRTMSAQTWDWKPELVRNWHFHRVAALPGGQSYAGFAEHGMTGKIGLNSAELGVHLNILKNTDDAPGGVPIHAVLARILSTASSVDEAISIAKDAPTSASSIITVLDRDRAVNMEINPHQVALNSRDGWALRTNHFACPSQADGAQLLTPDSNTHGRMDYLEAATTSAGEPHDLDDMLQVLCSPLEDGLVSVLPDPAAPNKGATLVTVRIDPANRRIDLSPGAPQFASDMTVNFTVPQN